MGLCYRIVTLKSFSLSTIPWQEIFLSGWKKGSGLSRHSKELGRTK